MQHLQHPTIAEAVAALKRDIEAGFAKPNIRANPYCVFVGITTPEGYAGILLDEIPPEEWRSHLTPLLQQWHPTAYLVAAEFDAFPHPTGNPDPNTFPLDDRDRIVLILIQERNRAPAVEMAYIRPATNGRRTLEPFTTPTGTALIDTGYLLVNNW